VWLSIYINTVYKYYNYVRFGRLVLLLPLLRMIRVETVEVLLFRETVGETGINNIILDVYNSHRLPLI